LLAKSPEVDEYRLNHLKQIMCGAAPLGADIEEQLMARFPKSKVVQGQFSLIVLAEVITGWE